jgi:hypothetical protein
MVFPPTAPWWSAGLTTPQGSIVPLSLDGVLVGCKTSARWAAVVARLMVFPPTAPWWSAGYNAAGRAFRWTAAGGMQNLGTLPNGRESTASFWMFPPTAPWWSAGLTTPLGQAACLSLDGFWWDARPRHAGRQ